MIYSIVYNHTQPIDSDHLHNIVTTAIMTTDWWHYLPNMYLINTTLNAAQITSTLQVQFPGMLFIVNKVDTSDYNGVLPRDAWEWLQKFNNAKNLIKLKKVSDTSYLLPLSKLFDNGKINKNQEPMKLALETLLKSGKK